ncbi:MAG TPA: pyridoxal phosphate-dependent aminotransferase, partial [Acidimicrobiales bacterium]|nr:pyridoxal phosphate-dependent aminotransferase [Acidimicrobiales bacterium]
AVEQAFATILDPGDEVILPAPYWTTYPEAIRLAGGVPVELATTEVTGFTPTIDQLEAARNSRTKALLFCSPSNPTGAVCTEEEIGAIGQWADEHGLWVITDEIYEHLTYGTASMHSLPVVVPAMADRTIVVNGVAKTYAMTGWRVGWLLGPPDVVKAAVNLQSHATSNVCNVAQRAALEAVSGDLVAVAAMRTAFDRRRQVIHRMLNEIDGVTCPEPQGAFYAFANLTGLLTPEAPTTLELADRVLEEAKVAFVPGEAFGTPGYARFSYALGDADLEEGITRLQKLFA